MSTLSTHVLDSARGLPAAGLPVQLVAVDAGSDTVLATGVTDADGRLSFDLDLGPGSYRLYFATGPWFEAAGRATFFPEFVVAFAIDPEPPHHHVALLLGPYSCTTYRGS